MCMSAQAFVLPVTLKLAEGSWRSARAFRESEDADRESKTCLHFSVGSTLRKYTVPTLLDDSGFKEPFICSYQ